MNAPLSPLVFVRAGVAVGQWISGEIAPPAGGRYERCTPALGVTVDVWDDEYCCWRRPEGQCEPAHRAPFRGVICANQDWPWRPVNDLMRALPKRPGTSGSHPEGG